MRGLDLPSVAGRDWPVSSSGGIRVFSVSAFRTARPSPSLLPVIIHTDNWGIWLTEPADVAEKLVISLAGEEMRTRAADQRVSRADEEGARLTDAVIGER